MAINWTSNVRTRNGNVAIYQGRCPIAGKHRLFDPKSGKYGTVWLLDDDGKCRGDKAPSEHDYAGAA